MDFVQKSLMGYESNAAECIECVANLPYKSTWGKEEKEKGFLHFIHFWLTKQIFQSLQFARLIPIANANANNNTLDKLSQGFGTWNELVVEDPLDEVALKGSWLEVKRLLRFSTLESMMSPCIRSSIFTTWSMLGRDDATASTHWKAMSNAVMSSSSGHEPKIHLSNISSVCPIWTKFLAYKEEDLRIQVIIWESIKQNQFELIKCKSTTIHQLVKTCCHFASVI